MILWRISTYQPQPDQPDAWLDETDCLTLKDLFAQTDLSAEEELVVARLSPGERFSLDAGRIIVERLS